MSVEVTDVELFQGDTGPVWLIGVPLITVDGAVSGYQTLTNFTCTLQITKVDGTVYTRNSVPVNTDNDRFLLQLSSTETDSEYMSVGKNRIVAEITDTSNPIYRSEIHIDVKIKSPRRPT